MMISSGTVAEFLEHAKQSFEVEGFSDPDVEARAVVAAGMQVSPGEIFSLLNEPMTEEDTEKCVTTLCRRIKREPIAYIEGRKNFYGREFSVDKRVLVPRPETELLVETAIREIKRQARPNPRIADVGTGSGCIAVTIARELPASNVVAIDISGQALEVAESNAKALKVDRVKWVQSDLFSGIPAEKSGAFDIIVSNPPYVASSELPDLEKDLSFEPQLALDGGNDGLRVIAPLISQARKMLAPGGVLLIEIGTSQGDAVRELLLKAGFSLIRIEKDYSGHDRIAKGVLSGSI